MMSLSVGNNGTFRNFLPVMKFLVYCAKIKEVQFEDPFTDRKLSIDALMEDVKPVATAKFELECRDVSQLISFCGLSGTQRYNKNDDFLIE